MTIYQRKDNQPFKWILAAAIFVLVLCIPLAEVFGDAPKDCPVGIVPECCMEESDVATAALADPISLLVLAGGLGVLYAVRLNRKKNSQ